MAKRFALLILVALVFGGCSKTSSLPQTKASSEFYSCHGCQTVGVRFDQPLQLSDVEALAIANKGNVISLWRQDPVCVAQKRSQFAYFRADAVVQRQIDKAPPVTDGGYSQALRSQFVDEWQKASQPGVKFTGAVLLVANSVTGNHLQTTALVNSYITDGANMIYLQGHEQAMAPLFAVDSSNC